MNTELLERIAAHIEAHPETFDMRYWKCGTVYCIAGHAVQMSRSRSKKAIDEVAAKVLDLDTRQPYILFHADAWPAQFVMASAGCPSWYGPQTGALGAARIRHFIATEGRE